MPGAGRGAKVTGKGVAIVVGRGVGIVPDRGRHIVVGELNTDIDRETSALPDAIFAIPVEPGMHFRAAAIRHLGVIRHMIGVSDIPAQVVIVAGVTSYAPVEIGASRGAGRVGIGAGAPAPNAVDPQQLSQRVGVDRDHRWRAVGAKAIIGGHFPNIDLGPIDRLGSLAHLEVACGLRRIQAGGEHGQHRRNPAINFIPGQVVVAEPEGGADGVGRPVADIEPAHFTRLAKVVGHILETEVAQRGQFADGKAGAGGEAQGCHRLGRWRIGLIGVVVGGGVTAHHLAATAGERRYGDRLIGNPAQADALQEAWAGQLHLDPVDAVATAWVEGGVGIAVAGAADTTGRAWRTAPAIGARAQQTIQLAAANVPGGQTAVRLPEGVGIAINGTGQNFSRRIRRTGNGGIGCPRHNATGVGLPVGVNGRRRRRGIGRRRCGGGGRGVGWRGRWRQWVQRGRRRDGVERNDRHHQRRR